MFKQSNNLSFGPLDHEGGVTTLLANAGIYIAREMQYYLSVVLFTSDGQFTSKKRYVKILELYLTGRLMS